METVDTLYKTSVIRNSSVNNGCQSDDRKFTVAAVTDGETTGWETQIGGGRDKRRTPTGKRRTEAWNRRHFTRSLFKRPAAELLQTVPPDSQNIYAELIKALELLYGDKHLREVYYAQLRTRRQRSGDRLQELEASIDRLIILAYPEAPENFGIRSGVQTFIDSIGDCELQQVLRMARHRNSSEALVHVLEFEACLLYTSRCV